MYPTLTAALARLADGLERMASGLAHLEAAVEAANRRIASATSAALEVAATVGAVEASLEGALGQPATPSAPREEVLAALNGTVTAEAPPCPPMADDLGVPAPSSSGPAVIEVEEGRTLSDEALADFDAGEGLPPLPRQRRKKHGKKR